MSINLVKNGIFPIIYDKSGNKLNSCDTGLNISGTIQGEGKLLGIPSLFIRTSGCNLYCSWLNCNGKGSPCDTAYSSFIPEINKMEINDIIQIIKNNLFNIRNIVISGGEPILQHELNILLEQLKSLNNHIHITLETNGTIYRDDIIQFVNLYSISPKLRNSIPTEDHLQGTSLSYSKQKEYTHRKNRKNIEAIQKYINLRKYSDNIDFQLKFVITSNIDIEEIWDEYLIQLKDWYNYDIILMPEGVTTESLLDSSKIALNACIRHGWRFTPRLQIDLFGNKRSV